MMFVLSNNLASMLFAGLIFCHVDICHQNFYAVLKNVELYYFTEPGLFCNKLEEVGQFTNSSARFRTIFVTKL